MKEKNVVAEIAAEWWLEKIKDIPSSKYNNGTLAQGGTPLAGILMAQLSGSDTTVTDDKEKAFVKILTELISERLNHTKTMYLESDYGPDDILARACNESGVPISKIPWKTIMYICGDTISVKYGYGAPWEDIC